MAEIKWIKIAVGIFDDEKILMIDGKDQKDSILIIWFKLLDLAGRINRDGVFVMSNGVKYTDEMLASIFHRDIKIVRQSLDIFRQFGMIEIFDDTIVIPNWSKYQSFDSYEKKKERDRIYQQERREKQRKIVNVSDECQTIKSSDVAISEEEKEEDKEKDKDKENREKRSFSEIIDLYHSICKSYPQIKSLSETRKKALRARLKTYDLHDFEIMFKKAEASDFLKGSNNRDWTATFDWMIKDSNMAKILDGNYDNRRKESQTEDAPYFNDNLAEYLTGIINERNNSSDQ